MAISTKRLAKGVFILCFTLTLCTLALRIYQTHTPVLTVQARYNQPSASTPTRKTNFIQRILHNAWEYPFGAKLSLPLPAVDENGTLARIEAFSGSRPANDTFGEDFLKAIRQRARLRAAQWQSDEKEYIRDSQFLNYLRCPTTLRAKMLQQPPSNQKFLPEVPLLMFNEHYSKNEYQRLSKFTGINGWKDMPEEEVAGALKALNTPSNRYLFDDRLVDGLIAPKNNGCVRCAVIGNGGMMNGSNKGKEIDAHDYVFRVNVALTKGFEKDLGAKTSFYCFTMVTLSNSLSSGGQFGFKAPPYEEGIRYVLFADSVWTYSYLNAVLHNKPAPQSVDKYKRLPPKFKHDLKAEDIKVIHPDFERYIRFSWVNSTAQHMSVHRPTTGAIMLLLALHTCDEVNVYGFAGSYTKFSEHYYDKRFQRHVFFANHDNNAENALWKRLHDAGVINLYTRD